MDEVKKLLLYGYVGSSKVSRCFSSRAPTRGAPTRRDRRYRRPTNNKKAGQPDAPALDCAPRDAPSPAPAEPGGGHVPGSPTELLDAPARMKLRKVTSIQIGSPAGRWRR